MDIRQATECDLDLILALLGEAKAHLKRLGVDQWQGRYPDRDTIQADLDLGAGCVLTDGPRLGGYMCVSFDGEPCYEQIDGAWLSVQPYAVIHRLALGNGWRGRGLAGLLFRHAEALCRSREVHSIKIDTHMRNMAMRRLVEQNGFLFCGTVHLPDGSRLAFEKLI